MVALLSLVAFSCEKDEETALKYADTSFETTYVKLHMSVGEMSQELEYSTKEELQTASLYSVIEFRKDGNVYIDDVKAGTWTESGNTITFTDEDGSEELEIIDDKITMEYSETENGMLVDVKLEYTRM